MHQLIESAVSAGRSFQSPQTGFVHFCYEMRDEESHDTIPVYENMLFALALLRTKNSAAVSEAKEILKKMLCFRVEGNFPKYLHEYPNCHDKYTSSRLLLPLYWILKRFFLVLGEDLRKLLMHSAEALLEHCCGTDREKEPPFQISIKIAAAMLAFGQLWEMSCWEEKGKKKLKELAGQSREESFGTWYSPQYLAETAIALQLCGPDDWPHFWDHLQKTYYRNGCSYIGPVVQQKQWGFEPEVTSYDLLMGSLGCEYSYRAFNNHPVQLQAALVFPELMQLGSIKYPAAFDGSVADHQWHVFQSDRYAFSALQKKIPMDPAMQKEFHPFCFVWGDVNNTHSLVCQGESASSVDFALADKGLDLEFLLAEPLSVDRKDRQKEVAFYCNRFEGTDIFVEGSKATVFNLSDKITIESEKNSIQMKFSLLEGEGRFMGHIMPGNRPSQANLQGTCRFEAFDWVISLRTVKRYTPCKIRVELQFGCR